MEPVEFRRRLHAHPELSFKEHDTAAFIEQQLDELGIEHRRIASTGVVARIEGRKTPEGDRRAAVLRAEEITGYLFGGLFLLLNLAALLFALRYHLSKRGKHLSDLFKPAPPAPPHVEAIRALEGLHNQKLWQNNKHKAYYSGLTDILRRYLAGRYGIGALEMTSDEIIDAVRPLDLPRKSAMELTALLREADLVKFAKATPEAARNEEAYQWAYYFVEETKPVEEQPSAEAEEPLDLTPKNDSHA
mgnify:CR=1 FL=1